MLYDARHIVRAGVIALVVKRGRVVRRHARLGLSREPLRHRAACIAARSL